MFMLTAAVNCGCMTETSPKGIRLSLEDEIISRTGGEGIFTPNGFVPTNRIYNIWTPDTVIDDELYWYNSTDGKVIVSANGQYMIYLQIAFNDPSGRKTSGIHVNNEVAPVAKCSSYYDSVEQPISKYYQCNTMIYTSLTGGDQVFIKTLQYHRAILPHVATTFWGVVKV